MEDKDILMFLKTKQLRARVIDKARIKSMLDSAENTIRVTNRVSLDEESATLIFREYYESIRQIGDAQWWLMGYEPRNHEVSIEILRENDIKEKLLLNKLLRFKKIRNNANYRGIKTSEEQAKEIVEFWDKCSKELIGKILNQLNQ